MSDVNRTFSIRDCPRKRFIFSSTLTGLFSCELKFPRCENIWLNLQGHRSGYQKAINDEKKQKKHQKPKVTKPTERNWGGNSS